MINGINDKRLISMPHHMNSQFVLETIIRVLMISVDVASM